MKRRPALIQLPFWADESYTERYMIVIEAIEGETPVLHLVPVPSWLVYYSNVYKYYCINLN